MPLADVPALLDRIAQGTVAPEDRSTLEALAEEAPGHVTAHVALARACELEGRWEAARRSWKRAHLLLPASPAVRAGLRRTTPLPDQPDADPDGASASRTNEATPSTNDALSNAAVVDLDSLIEELDDARIEPTPDPDDVPAPDLDTGDADVVSPTLARIYEAQGQFAEAAHVHRRLAEDHPAEAEAHRREAEVLEARAEEQRQEEE